MVTGTTMDYYETLGVSRSASVDEMRKAYRKLSKQYHPDRNKGDAAAETKFKQVQDAWDVLSDETKRRQYDQYGQVFPEGRGPQSQGGGPAWNWPGGGGGSGGGMNFDLDDLLGGFGGKFGGRGGARGPAGLRRGQDVQSEITVPFQVAAEGGKYDVTVARGASRESLTVSIPAGLEPGSTIRLRGQGQPGPGGGPAGDLLVTVTIAPHPYFRREGANLMVDVPLTPAEAALGARVEVPTLADGTVTMTVPAGTSTGAKLRLRGKGLTDRKSGTRGDLLAVMKVVVPKALSDRERELYQELSDVGTDHPRTGLWS